MANFPKLSEFSLSGFKAFNKFLMRVGDIEVIAGANGAGKTSLFEFLRFIRDSLRQEIPSEIVRGATGQQIFHKPGPDEFVWGLHVKNLIHNKNVLGVSYTGHLAGPKGNPRISLEEVFSVHDDLTKQFHIVMRDGNGTLFSDNQNEPYKEGIGIRISELALGTITNKKFLSPYSLRNHILDWRFYFSPKIDRTRISGSVPIEQTPFLREDGGNLSAVLFYLSSEHEKEFRELELHLKGVIPGFKGLSLKARGGPGEIMAFFKEDGVDDDLSLADVSDGIIRILCWFSLCVHPHPPTLVCIDEPELGIHPRVIPVLAGLLEKLSERTQVLVATHNSYFLTQFDISNIAVMKKENGEVKFLKPGDSDALRANLEDFGQEEIELMHRSDELESLI